MSLGKSLGVFSTLPTFCRENNPVGYWINPNLKITTAATTAIKIPRPKAHSCPMAKFSAFLKLEIGTGGNGGLCEITLAPALQSVATTSLTFSPESNVSEVVWQRSSFISLESLRSNIAMSSSPNQDCKQCQTINPTSIIMREVCHLKPPHSFAINSRACLAIHIFHFDIFGVKNFKSIVRPKYFRARDFYISTVSYAYYHSRNLHF